MKKIGQILKNKEIMNRIMFTILILIVFRIGAQITVPGVTLGDDLQNYLDSSYALSLMNLLGGGTLQSFSIFALGVSPYITAQIIVELLSTDVLPALTELKRQGQSGRKKIELATRYLTLMLGAVQAYGIIQTMKSSEAITFVTASQEWLTYIYIIVIMMAGSMIVMWLGDQISVKGIGNGISMIIFAGIVCSLPSQIGNAFSLWVGNSALQGQGDSARIAGIFKFLLYILAYVLIISFVTFIELSKRKIPVQHSGKGGGQTQSMSRASFLPIKVNSAGVIPVIFASSILMAPSVIVAFVDAEHSSDTWLGIFQTSTLYEMPGGWKMPWGLIIYLVLTIAFTFFYANVQINPQQLAENFQKNGSYIPGIHTGNETERYVRKVLNRVTFIGAMALALIAALPVVLTLTVFKDNPSLALGGTGLIIVVGVALEVNNQIDGLLAGKSFDEVVAGGGR
ncbi:MAG: preprotein translocase subunit SecY [Bacilli bacterium]|nr:preprotein translocase subunit SecY [Bacilli bacterium]